MDKSRLLSQLDLLEKYVAGKSCFKSKDEEIIHFRNITGTILSLIEGPERLYRDVVIKHSGQIDALVNTLQTVTDSQTSYNVIKIINELVGRSNSGKRAQALVHHGVSKALLQCIYLEAKEAQPCEEYLFLLHQVLHRVAVKDKRIGVRARISQCLPVIVTLLRTQINLVPHSRGTTGNIPITNSLAKNITILLSVLKLYSQNLINTSRLGRIGIITLLLKIINYSGKNNMAILKISIETLNLCVRTKSNSSRAVNQGAMSMLLELFLDWYRIDNKDKQLTLRKCILNVIKNLINLRSGKKAFLEADGLHTLYGFCDANKLQNNIEALVTVASLILRKCFPKNRLPLSHYGSVMRCPLPNTTIQNKARLLMEDYSKTESSPSAPRSTSPIDPIMPILNCQGDNEKVYTGIRNFESDEYFQEVIVDDNLAIEPRCMPLEKQNSRIRALNLFRSLDRKLSATRKDSILQQHHQSYLNRCCTYLNESDPNPTQQKSPIVREFEQSNSPYQDYADEKKDKNEQILIEQILVNSMSYQPPDDRQFDKLKSFYDKYFPERELFKKSNQDLKKKSSIDELDKSEKSENSFESGTACSEFKNGKAKEVLSPSIISVQLKTSPLDRRLSRNTLRRNEISPQKLLDPTDEKSGGFVCSGLSLQKRDSIPLISPGLYTKSKRLYTQSRNENININSMINELVDPEKKSNDYLFKNDLPFAPLPCDRDSDYANKMTNDEPGEEFTDTYIRISSLITRSLGRFSMIAYPDLMESSVHMNQPEPLSESFLQNLSLLSNDEVLPKSNNNNNSKKSIKIPLTQTKKLPAKSNKNNSKASNVQRPLSAVSNADALAQNKILDDLRRIIDGEDILDKVVFDLESIIQNSMSTYNLENSCHSNSDELQIDKLTPLQSPCLQFDSQFECGNLRKAIQIRQYEYDLILNPDVNNNHQIQWFYFRVSAMEAGLPYRFNIINCEKPNSQFNFGMQPLLYSVKEAMLGKSYWKRYGSEIFYYKNHFARSAATCGGNTGKSYFTFTFVIDFPYSADVCYIAYHYPYTYTRLLTDLHNWTRNIKSSKIDSDVDADGDSKEKSPKHEIEFYSVPEDNILFYVQELCTTILGNPVPVLTISNWPKESPDRPVSQKPYIFLTSRVHPGESNASWVMKGCIDYLLSNSPIAQQLRNNYIFKIVPMLNPDGVINGCHRCSMAGHDLNRRWMDPCEFLNPTIYHTKGLLMLLSKYGQSPLVFCDFHGHSRRKNVFMFGCSPFMSWISEDTNNPSFIDQKTEDKSYLILPNILNNISQAFSLDCCSFTVEKSKESTARVVVWRQFGVQKSYTMESTYCSFDQGSYKHLHINVPMLQEIGSQFIEALLHIDDSIISFPTKPQTLPKVNQDYNSNGRKLNGISGYPRTNSLKSYESTPEIDGNPNEDDEINSNENVKNDDDEDDNSSNDDFDEDEESDKDVEYNDEEDVEDSD